MSAVAASAVKGVRDLRSRDESLVLSLFCLFLFLWNGTLACWTGTGTGISVLVLVHWSCLLWSRYTAYSERKLQDFFFLFLFRSSNLAFSKTASAPRRLSDPGTAPFLPLFLSHTPKLTRSLLSPSSFSVCMCVHR